VDVQVDNGTLSLMSSSDEGRTWVGTYTPTADVEDATNSVRLLSSYTDLAGNTGTPTTSTNYAVDTRAPTATVTMSDTDLKVGETATVTIAFNEPVVGFSSAQDVQVDNGVLSAMSSTDGGKTWVGTFTPNTGTEATGNTVRLLSTYADAAGNAGTAASSPTYTVDTQGPTATIVLADTALKAGETSLVTITFSEPVVDFDNSDLTVAGGTPLMRWTGQSRALTATCTCCAGAPGTRTSTCSGPVSSRPTPNTTLP
jgi:hypothetical protein